MVNQLVMVVCPQCNHMGKYWLKAVEDGEATCHVCEAPVTERNIVIV